MLDAKQSKQACNADLSISHAALRLAVRPARETDVPETATAASDDSAAAGRGARDSGVEAETPGGLG